MDYKISIDTGTIIKTRDFYSEPETRYDHALGHYPGLRKIVQRFLPLLPSNTRVLDVGCGTGKPVSFMITESGHQPYGIDL